MKMLEVRKNIKLSVQQTTSHKKLKQWQTDVTYMT